MFINYTTLTQLTHYDAGVKHLIEFRRFNTSSNISNTRDSVSSGYPNTEKRVENTTRRGVFLTKLEVFKNAI